MNTQELENLAFIGETLGPLYLYEPSDEAVQGLYEAFANVDVESAAQEWPFGDKDTVKHAIAEMKKGAEQAASNPEKKDELLWEYRRLFVGPGKKETPPWGSVYTDREQVVFGQSTLALRDWMNKNGISRVADDSEPEDHIGLMLLMLAWISQSYPELVSEYLSQHLLPWAGHFADLVEGAATEPFFKGLAELSAATFEGIQAELGLEVETPRFYR